MLSENFLLLVVHIYHKLQNNYENISYTFLIVYICIPYIISWEIFRKMFLLVHYICAVPHSLLLDFAIKIGVEFCDLSLDCIRLFACCALVSYFSKCFLRVFQIVAEHATIFYFDFIFIYNTFSLLNWANDCGLRFKIETESAQIESKRNWSPETFLILKEKTKSWIYINKLKYTKEMQIGGER